MGYFLHTEWEVSETSLFLEQLHLRAKPAIRGINEVNHLV